MGGCWKFSAFSSTKDNFKGTLILQSWGVSALLNDDNVMITDGS